MNEPKRRRGLRRGLSLLLSLCMLLTLLPVSALAAEADKTVAAFDALDGSVAAQTVPEGTAREELNLPETLAASVYTVSLDTGTPNTEAAVIEHVTWTPDPAYDGAAGERYTFTASAEGYVCAAEVSWPQITVTVAAAESGPSAYDAAAALFAALPGPEAVADMTDGEKDALSARLGAAFDSLDALPQADFDRFAEEHAAALANWRALQDALTGGVETQAADGPDWAESGDGTLDSPYVIKTYDQLTKFAQNVSGTGNYTASNFSGKYIQLDGSFPTSGTLTTAIGTGSNSFKGNFDGGGKTVNLKIEASNSDYQGLFGYMTGGTVKNVTVSGTVSGKGTVGGVAGISYGTVENCVNTATVTGTGTYVGGVVGYTYGTVSSCYNTGAVSSGSSGGGVAGYLSGSGTVSNCVSLGATVTATGSTSTKVGRVAGSKGTNATLTGNKARGDMKVYKNTSTEVTSITSDAAGIHGETVEVGDSTALSDVFSSSSGWDTGVWTVPADGKLVVDGDLPTLNAVTGVAQNPTLPEPIPDTPKPTADVSGTKIYANGVPLILAAGSGDSTKTVIYIDKDGDGEINTPDDTIFDPDGNTIAMDGTDVGNDLSSWSIYGGGTSALTGGTKITMTGGNVASLYGGGSDSGATVDSTTVTVSGGEIGVLDGGGRRGAAVSGAATVTVSDGKVTSLYGGGDGSGATVDSTSVTVSGGEVAYLYGGGESAPVTGAATVSVTGGTVKTLYGGSEDSDATVGSKSVTVGGGAQIGGASGSGVVLNGGRVANGVEKFAIGDDLTGAAGCVCVNLPEGYDVTSNPTIATDAVQTDLAKIKLTGGGATGNEAYFDSTTSEIKVRAAGSTDPAATGGTIESGTDAETVKGYFGTDGATVTVTGNTGVITLQKDVTLSATVNFNDTGRDWTLDLNGRTLAGAQPTGATSDMAAIGVTPVTLTAGKLTVTSTAAGGTLLGGDGNDTYTNSSGLGGNGGHAQSMPYGSNGLLTLTDNNVTLQGGDGKTATSSGGGLVAWGGTVTLDGVTCKGGSGGTTSGNGGSGVHLGTDVTVPAPINCTAQSGTTSGTEATGLFCAAAATISGGSYTGKTGLYAATSGVTLKGGTFVARGDGSTAIATVNALKANSLLAAGYGYYIGDALQTVAGDATSVGEANQTVTVKEKPAATPTPTVSDKTIYANGVPLILAAGSGDSTKTVIYIDTNDNGQVDSGTDPIFDPDGDTETMDGTDAGNDLSGYGIYGGGRSALTADPKITMLGGKVNSLYGGGSGSGGTVTGNPTVTVSGGTVGGVYGGGDAAVSGAASVTVSGGKVTNLYGGGSGGTVGNTAVTVSGSAEVTNLYGGGNNAAVNGDPSVTVSGGKVTNLYGGGRIANVTGAASISITGGTVSLVYGGGNASNSGKSANVASTQVAVSGTAQVGFVYGGGYALNGATANVTGTASVSITGGTVSSSVYGGGSAIAYGASATTANVIGAASVSITGGTVGNVYGGGSGDLYNTSVTGTATANVGEGSTVTVGGTAQIGSANGDGVRITGGTEPITNGVDSFKIDPDLNGSASVSVVLPAGYDVTGTPTIATDAVQTDLAKIKLTGGGATGKEAYLDGTAIKVKTKPSATVPTVTTTSLPDGTVGTTYSQTLTATGTTPITWSVSAGSLPAGLSLSGAVISGIPTTAGTSTFTVKAENSAGSATKQLTIKIDAAAQPGVAPTITTTTLAGGTVGEQYSATLTATGDMPITWSVSAGSLPNGLTLSGNTISGIPTTAETFTFTVKAVNATSEDTQELSIAISAPAPTVTGVTVSPSTATVKKGTTQQFSATVTGENDPAQTVTWAVTGGAKAETTIDSNGLLTVASDETATTLTVTAISDVDSSQSGTATVTVTDEEVTRYTLTVTDGSGSGDYAEDAQITVTAETKANQRFKEWTATGIELADKTANPVTITMPANAVTLTATYEDVYAVTVTSDSNGTATASPATAAQGETVTLTATANSGYQFKAWTIISGGITLDANASTSFTMPGQAVEVKAVFELQTTPPPIKYTLTVSGSYAGTTGAGSYAPGATVTISAGSRSGYSFTGWTVVSGSITLANQNQSTTTFEMPAANVEVQANWSRNSTGGSDNGSSNSSSGGSYTPPTITDPKPSDKPNAPTTAETDVTARTDSKGNAEIDVPSNVVDNAIDKALDAAKKNGAEDNGVAVQINVTTGKSATGKAADTITVNLPKTTQERLIAAEVSSFTVVVDRPDIAISLSLDSIREIHTQANADVQLTATRMTDTSTLSAEARTAIGTRPVFQLTASYRGGKVTDFGAGNVSVEIPYTLQKGELAGNVYAVYVDDNGKVTYLTNSSYDSKRGVLMFTTDHFSTYGIGYKTSITFDDIQDHWAKEDIEFVASRGLLNGTGNNQFSPDGSMTRAMFVTALGRLAGIDAASYRPGAFTDVPATAYYAPYVEWAAQKGIVQGTGSGKFSPDAIVTRQQMAAIMSNYAKAMGYTVPATRETMTFTDSAIIATWATGAVKQMQRAGVLMGKDGNRFDPTAAASRAEASAVLRRYLELVIDWQSTQGWSQNDSGSWMYYQDGKPVTGERAIGGTTYHFDANGILQKIDAVAPEGKKYLVYVVKQDDTLWDLAEKYGCTVAEIVALNGEINNPNLILVGQEIKIPQK